MAKLRHLALLTDQPEKLADFYKRVFELQETHRSANGAIQLSDGEFNLTIQHTRISSLLKPSSRRSLSFRFPRG